MDWTEKIVNHCPKLFKNLKYIECSDSIGWEPLIGKLASLIEVHLVKNKISNIHAFQVKQKLGELRFYLDNDENEYLYGLICMAESLSTQICEKCSNHGSIKKIHNYYLTILCGGCFAKEENNGKVGQ